MKIFMVCIAFLATYCYAQEFSKAIEDNSFFIEEAYNQEERVIQHIFNGTNFSPGNILETSFTEEWPVFSQTHQLSITVPYQYSAGITASKGISDLLVNYRYQLINEDGLAIAPRISIILPTGDDKEGFGNGAVGVQFNLPVSRRFSDEIVTHYNAGCSVIPNARVSASPSKETFTEYFFGASGIYLANPHFNVMAEVLYSSSGSASFGRTKELILSPGVRWAIDIHELQIVPGLAFPIHFVNGNSDTGFVLYLSFEHFY